MPLPRNTVGVDGIVTDEISNRETQTDNNQNHKIQCAACPANIFPEVIKKIKYWPIFKDSSPVNHDHFQISYAKQLVRIIILQLNACILSVTERKQKTWNITRQ